MVSSSTGNTFYLNTTPSSFNEAEEGCKKGGGHLAAFESADEQAEVEQYYISNGYLMSAHVFYWIGLNKTGAAWGWVAPDVPASSLTTFNNWGTQGSDACGGATTSPAGKSSATFGATWSWTSKACNMQQVYICRMAPPGEFHYTTTKYKSEYVLNTQPASFNNALQQCQVSVGRSWGFQACLCRCL